MIFQIKDKFGNSIRLTDERWKHVVNRHPEIKSYIEKVKTTIKDPEILVSNPYHPYEKYYHHFFPRLKNYIIVILEQQKGFIITAYIARKIKKGKIEWKKN